MVLVSSKKYACETCIKGHRSSACKHTDRPLFEIKKKGRPVTQCEHCRELRKTKQVHVKCLCESKEDAKAPAASGNKKKCGNKVPESAAFPHGLPEALGASVAVQLPSDGSSDSDHSGELGCNCKDGGNCNCCTPRKNVPRHRRKDSHPSTHPTDDSAVDAGLVDSKSKRSPTTSSNIPLSSHILARIAELRPVLPRPPISAGPLHDPSSGVAHGSGVRHHTHDNMYFSPYGRAYEHIHTPDRTSHDRSNRVSPPRPIAPAMERKEAVLPPIRTEWPADGTFPSMCGCGDACACPGCKEHNGGTFNDNANAFSSCANPDNCTTCLDCTIASVASALPCDTPLSMYEVDQSIDEWLRQVGTLPPNGESYSPSQAQVQAPWDALQLPRISGPPSDCGSDCHCPPGLCTCHRQQLTFAVSGERGCYPPTSQLENECAGRRGNFLTVSVDDARSCSPASQPSQVPSRPRSQEIVYALSNPDSEPTSHEEYTTAANVNSNPASEHSHDDFEYRQPTGVYAMSNPDSELSHEEFEYDPRFDYAPPLAGMRAAVGSGEGGNRYPISNPDSEVSLENFEQYPYGPSLDGMQLY